jgi:tectonic-1/3
MIKILVLTLFFSYALAYPPVLVPIDWNNVPSTTLAARNLNSPHLGECVCDITWGVCDPYCCCDEDCDAATINSFSYCLPEKYSSPYLDYCYPKDRATALKKINNIHATYLDKKKQGYNAICVIRANHPSELYRYFRVPTSVQKPATSASPAPSVAENQTYAVGTPLLFAKRAVINGVVSYRRADAFLMPVTADDGSCSTLGRAVGYLDSLQGVSCALNGAQICAEIPTSKITSLFVQSTAWYGGQPSALIPVVLNIHNSSGVLVNTIDPNATVLDNSYLSYADSTTCHNAVIALTAQFTYKNNFTGTITAAVVNATVTDVGLGRYAALRFEAGFVAQNKTLPTNVIAGTPGYLPGYKVRAGTFVSNGERSAILEQESGFAVPSGGRLCSVTPWKRSSFLFSVLSSGCVVPMSESEMQAICSTGTASLISGLINKTVGGVSTGFDRVAITNDAFTNDTSSWIAIDGLAAALTSSSGTYHAYDRACENIMVGLHYQFVIARAGAEYNAQDIIVGAFASPVMGTLKIRNQTVFDSSATSLQRVIFKVSFSRYNPNSQATIMRRVVAPPILPRLDDTIFYPFRRPYPL